MAKKQTRKSISVSKELYVQLKEHCAVNNTSMSTLTEMLVREHLDMQPRVLRPAVKLRSAWTAFCRHWKVVGRAAKDIESNNKRDQVRAAKLRRKSDPITVIKNPILPALVAAEAAERQQAYENYAVENPCRDEKCHITQLHPAH